MATMQRLMSCDPGVLSAGSGVSDLTSSCHRFHASRIQAAERLHCKANQLRRRLEIACDERLKNGLKEGLMEGLKDGLKNGLKDGLKDGVKDGLKDGLMDGLKEELVERRLFSIVNEIAKLASRDVKIADQLGRTSDEADKIRQKFHRYQNWSASCGLSPSVDVTASSSFDDFSISPATIPRTADVSSTRSNLYEKYSGNLELAKRNQNSNFPFPLLNPVYHFLEDASSRDTKVETNQTAAGDSINLRKSHSILLSPSLQVGLKDREKHSTQAVKAAKNQIINNDAAENKIHDVEIYISDYDNKLHNEEKSGVKFELVPCPDGIIGRDLRQNISRKWISAAKISCKEEIDTKRDVRKLREKFSTDKIDKSVCGKIDSEKLRDSRANNTSYVGVTNSTFPRPKMSRPSEIKDHLEKSSPLHRTRERGQPPEVPVKMLSLSMIKRTTKNPF